MPQLVLECPHCKAERIGFAPRGAVPAKPGTSRTLLFMQCEGCGEAVVVVTGSDGSNVTHWMQAGANSPGTIVETYPKPSAIEAPADIPTDWIRTAFLSGVDNLGRRGGANAAVAMFRRSIELAARHIDRKAPANTNLKQRIELLPDSVVTPAMKEWAHHIRLGANEGVHEPEEFSEKEAKQLHIFAEMFLTYAFTLPAMLERAKTEVK
jgi:hypothetical protein